MSTTKLFSSYFAFFFQTLKQNNSKQLSKIIAEKCIKKKYIAEPSVTNKGCELKFDLVINVCICHIYYTCERKVHLWFSTQPNRQYRQIVNTKNNTAVFNLN